MRPIEEIKKDLLRAGFNGESIENYLHEVADVGLAISTWWHQLGEQRQQEIYNAACENRLMVPPCKVGDTVYWNNGATWIDRIVKGFIVDTQGNLRFDFGDFAPLVACDQWRMSLPTEVAQEEKTMSTEQAIEIIKCASLDDELKRLCISALNAQQERECRNPMTLDKLQGRPQNTDGHLSLGEPKPFGIPIPIEPKPDNIPHIVAAAQHAIISCVENMRGNAIDGYSMEAKTINTIDAVNPKKERQDQ